MNTNSSKAIFKFIKLLFDSDLFPLSFVSFKLTEMDAFLDIFNKQANTYFINPVLKIFDNDDLLMFENKFHEIFDNHIYCYEIGISPETIDILSQISKIISLKKNHIQILLTFKEKIDDLKQFLREIRKLDFPILLKNSCQYSPILLNVKLIKCPALKEEIAFDSQGNVYPCRNGFISESIIGNIHSDSLQSLLNQKIENNYLCSNCNQHKSCCNCYITHPYSQMEFCKLIEVD